MQSPCEPMALGSPISQAASPSIQGQNPFLPAYLMGEQSSAGSSPASRLWASGAGSPPKAAMGSKSGSWSSPGHGSSGWAGPAAQASNHSLFVSPRSEQRQREVLSGRPKEKTGAPPVQGLMESICSPTGTLGKQNELDMSQLGNMTQIGTPFTVTPSNRLPGATSTPGVLTPSGHVYSQPKKTPPSPAQVDPFYTQGESLHANDDLDETWITIFGFPPAATSFILQQFSQYGTIVKHVIAPDGNWIHVHYQSKLQAKKALSKNGKVFRNSIMVGVAPCIDKNVMHCGKENADTSVIRTSYYGTPTSHLHQSISERAGSNRGTPIRPLTAAYKASSSDYEVAGKTNTPQKNTNVLSKAMEYMFGW